jgi:hypothetical protein
MQSFRCNGIAGLGLMLAIATAATAQGQPAVDPRLEQAIAWYTGTAGRVDDDRAHGLLLEAVAGGSPIARMWLARCHSRGRMRIERDTAKANAIAVTVIGEIHRLADAGVSEAVFLIGTAYDEGLGVPADPVIAAAWFHRAADTGHVLAQHNLGNAYADGRGVAKIDAMAVYWWRKAARSGDAIAQVRLAQMYEQGRGVAMDLAEAVRWYRRSAERGNALAAEALKRLVPPR